VKKSEYGKIIVRIAVSLIVLWFGITQLRNPEPWTRMVPSFLTSLMGAKPFIIFNGSFEILFGLMLLLGFYARFAALILWVHILIIAVNLVIRPSGSKGLRTGFCIFIDLLQRR